VIKIKKSVFTVAVIILLVVAIMGVGCRRNIKNQVPIKAVKPGYPLQITDSYQRRVTLKREPKRVISVAPNITEIIYALGKDRVLVGRSSYCDYPAAVRRVTAIGSLTDPNIEKILQLQPDLVIASTHFKKEVVAKLESLGVKVIVLYGAESFDGVYQTIRQVGIALNARQASGRVINAMRRKVGWVTTQVKGLKQPQVYYVVGFGKTGDYTAGADTFIGNMLEMAGGNNVAADTRGWQYSLEKLVAKNPEIVICSRYFNTKKALEHSTGYRDLPAVKAGRLFEIDDNLLDRQGPRLADGLVALARLLHPEIFIDKNGKKE
jgi:iron complex transport system substrate-binding protein